MNIYELRQCIQVTNYYTHSEGAMIYYIKAGHTNIINLVKDELITELKAIGSLDEDSASEEQADYYMSQWDALTIAIRYEQAREMEKEIDNSDIGKAINKFKTN